MTKKFFQNQLNRLILSFEPQGPPPASKSALNSLPQVELDSNLQEQMVRCSVCFDEMENDREKILVKLPCTHIFHKECVSTWLSQHNTCPNCRYELPVEDPQYEKQRKSRMSSRRLPIDENEFFPQSQNVLADDLDSQPMVEEAEGSQIDIPPPHIASPQQIVTPINIATPPVSEVNSAQGNETLRERRRRKHRRNPFVAPLHWIKRKLSQSFCFSGLF